MFKQKCSLVHQFLPIPERDCLLQRIIKIESKLADPPPDSYIWPAEEAGMAAGQGTSHSMNGLSDRLSGFERIIEETSNHVINMVRDISTLKQQSAKMDDEYKATDNAIRNLENTSVLSESKCVRVDGRIDACFALTCKIIDQAKKQDKEMADKISGNTEKLSFLSDVMDDIKDKVADNTKKLASLSDGMDNIKDKNQDIDTLAERLKDMVDKVEGNTKKLSSYSDLMDSIKDKTQEYTDQLTRDNKSVNGALETLHKRILDHEELMDWQRNQMMDHVSGIWKDISKLKQRHRGQ